MFATSLSHFGTRQFWTLSLACAKKSTLSDRNFLRQAFGETVTRAYTRPASRLFSTHQSVQRRRYDGPEPAYEKVVTGYRLFQCSQPLLMDHGGVLPKFDIAYETWGELSEKKDNVILLHTGLSASSHAKSHSGNQKEGWWEKFIGPNAPLDTNKFHIICTNVLGSCYGSTGPNSVYPDDGNRYATRFPIITIWDMVRAQFLMLDSMGITKLRASVGASMGGMQSLAASILYPNRVGKLVTISGCARSHPYSIALRHTQREALMADPNWNKGFYYNGKPPHIGMKLAREIATISYRSGPEWEQRFGRKRANHNQEPSLKPDFLIETYLDHQGERFCHQYDANSLLYVSKAMDLFDATASATLSLARARERRLKEASQINGGLLAWAAARTRSQTSLEGSKSDDPQPESDGPDKECPTLCSEDLVRGVYNTQMSALVLGVQSDILFPVWQQREIATSLRKAGNPMVTYYELDSIYGHDTFLIDLASVGSAVKGHLEGNNCT